jgi:hypothetical protein
LVSWSAIKFTPCWSAARRLLVHTVTFIPPLARFARRCASPACQHPVCYRRVCLERGSTDFAHCACSPVRYVRVIPTGWAELLGEKLCSRDSARKSLPLGPGNLPECHRMAAASDPGSTSANGDHRNLSGAQAAARDH